MPRNATSFIVKKIQHPGKAGAILFVRGVEMASGKPAIVGMNHACPCGCGIWGFMAFPAYGIKECWEPQPKDGDDLTKLTLRPSIGIRKKEGGHHWHGWLRNGVFEEG